MKAENDEFENMEKMAAIEMEDNKVDGSSTSSVVYEGEDNADEAEG